MPEAVRRALLDSGVPWAGRTGAHELIVTPPPARGSGEARLELYDPGADARERSLGYVE